MRTERVKVILSWRTNVRFGLQSPLISLLIILHFHFLVIPELEALFDCLSFDVAVVADTAAQSLVWLVENDVTDLTFTLNALLNNAPSAKTCSGIAKAVCELLCLEALVQLSTSDQQYACPYQIRNPPHPLVTLLTNSPDCWHHIVEQVARILAWRNRRVQVVSIEILRPFIAFVLLEPQQSAQYALVRDGLRGALLDACQENSDTDTVARCTIQCLLNSFTKLQFEGSEKISAYSYFLVSIIKAVRGHLLAIDVKTGNRPDDSDSLGSRMFWTSAASKCTIIGIQTITLCLQENVPASRLADALISLCQTDHFGITADKTDYSAILLSDLLCRPAVLVSPMFLRLASSIVSKYKTAATRVCLAALIPPVLRLLALPTESLEISKADKDVHLEAKSFLEVINTSMITSQDTMANVTLPPSPLSPTTFNDSNLMAILLSDLFKTKSSTDRGLEVWLVNLASSLTVPQASFGILSNVVSAILFTIPNPHVVKAAVIVLAKIAQLDPTMAPDLLPVLLHALGRIASPECRLVILNAMPTLATHKFCVAPVLKTIQALTSCPSLKAVSIKMLMLLWQQQDRVFPHLLRAINEAHPQPSLPLQTSIDEVLLAKAAAIHEICKLRPEQHGAELLQPLSNILNSEPAANNTTACAIALEGLFLLCQAEVIDLRSLWSVLGEKLKDETRSIVICKICTLLSLVPELSVESQEYQEFTEDVVSYLWLYSLSPDPDVRRAAFDALSNFDGELFKVRHLPEQLTEHLRYQLELANRQAQQADSEVAMTTLDEMFPTIPGSLYINLLQTIKEKNSLAGYEKLLKALAVQEVTNLPRGIFYSSLRRQGLAGNQGKALQGVPSLILHMSSKCQEPGLRPGLAGGLLFCYDPAVEVGRDGRARKHYVIRHGKAFLQMFSTLLLDVPVQPSDWHLFTLLPQAWNSFMERLFVALLESRKAELELQEKHGHADSDEVKGKKSLAWLWVREAILDAIKSSSKGNPATQSNCLLAMSSLISCVLRFVSDLDPEITQASDASSEFMGHSHWLTVSCDTILSFIKPDYKPRGGVHGLCHQSSGSNKAPASTMCMAVARIAASQLVPVYTAIDSNRILDLLEIFTTTLSKQKLMSPIQILCNDLALGMLLSRLFEEHFSEMTSGKGMLAVWKALSALENLCLSSDLEENRLGCVLGLGIAICGLCNEGKTESRVHVKSMFQKLHLFWSNMTPDNPLHQTLSITMASVCGSMYACNLSEEENVKSVLDTLKTCHESQPQSSGVSLALGLLTFSLSKQGYQAVSPLRQDLAKNWPLDIQNTETLPLEKVAKLNGLLALVGSEQSLIHVHGSSKMTESDIDSSKVIAMVTNVLVYEKDIGLQNISAWMLGHLYLSACSGTETRTAVPTNYSYLPEASILRAVVDFLSDAGKSGPELISDAHVMCGLQCLKTRKALPPLNWAGVLSTIMRISFGAEVKSLCLQIASSQMASSPTATMFMSSWIVPPLFFSLPTGTQTAVHRQMPETVKAVSPGVLKVYFERSCLQSFTMSKDTSLFLAILLGLRDSMALEDPPAAVTFLLYETVGQVYYLLPNEFNIPLLKAMAECMAQMSDDILDSIIGADFSDLTTQIKGCFIRCHLVATKRQPLALLNYMIDASFNTDCWQPDTGSWFLCHCLAHFSKSKDGAQTVEKQKWFLELLGHTSSIVKGAMPLADASPPMTEVIRRIISLVSCALMTMSFPSAASVELLGLDPCLFTNISDDEIKSANTSNACFQDQPLHLQSLVDVFGNVGNLLPTVSHIVNQKPWYSLTSKTLDWIQTTLQVPEISVKNREILIDAIMSMRGSADFRQALVWTKSVLLSC